MTMTMMMRRKRRKKICTITRKKKHLLFAWKLIEIFLLVAYHTQFINNNNISKYIHYSNWKFFLLWKFLHSSIVSIQNKKRQQQQQKEDRNFFFKFTNEERKRMQQQKKLITATTSHSILYLRYFDIKFHLIHSLILFFFDVPTKPNKKKNPKLFFLINLLLYIQYIYKFQQKQQQQQKMMIIIIFIIINNLIIYIFMCPNTVVEFDKISCSAPSLFRFLSLSL